MRLPIWDPLFDLVRAALNGAAVRTASAVVSGMFALAAMGLLVSAGLVTLVRAVGYPAAALLFAVLFALLAPVAYVCGQILSGRLLKRRMAARARADRDLALARVLGRSLRPLMPVAAFLIAFGLARRPP